MLFFLLATIYTTISNNDDNDNDKDDNKITLVDCPKTLASTTNLLSGYSVTCMT